MKYIGELKEVYNQLLDCRKNGANSTNCHFSLFSTPEKTKAWEDGKKNSQSK